MNWTIKTFDELTTKELYEILKSRAEIFVKEQKISYVDPDGVDCKSWHVFATEGGRVCAYLRAFKDGDGVIKIGRVLTLVHGKGTGSQLMKYAISELKAKTGCQKIIMDAQSHAISFYQKLGFKITSEEYLEEGIPHVDMELAL
ncbi:MAG: GNAT family N-acetyltransferase [Treponema sp.]|nr:GNAT family N-acetyltransferase [Treponema sp.]